MLLTEVRIHAADTSSHFCTALFAILLGTSVVAFLYNYVHARLINVTSATTTTVIGQVKIVGLMVLSAALLGKISFYPTVQRQILGLCSHASLLTEVQQNHLIESLIERTLILSF